MALPQAVKHEGELAAEVGWGQVGGLRGRGSACEQGCECVRRLRVTLCGKMSVTCTLQAVK